MDVIKLVISDNEGTTTVVPLVRDDVSIGRKDGNTIRLTERNISREHCQLQRVNGNYVIRDLGSYNGVLLNGQRIAGQSEVKPGDEIRIGDYTLLLQSDAEKAAEAAQQAAVTAPPQRQAARLVVLTPPLAGAEFALPERGELRIGRAPELDIAIDHRSVSREHAAVACDAAEVRILDRGSVNGVVVNHEKVTEARLSPGDVVELGDVLLRFVGADEHYVFDPEHARVLTSQKRGRARVSWPAAVAIGVGALFVAILIVRSGPKVEPARASIAPEPARAPEVAAKPAPAPPDRFPELLNACVEANAGGRFAEAVAHANGALKLRPDAPEALACQQSARANHEQEQIYVRAKATLEGGEVDAALKELSGLQPDGTVRQRAEVVQTIESAAKQQLARAQQISRKQAVLAAELARRVLALAPLPPSLTEQAQALIARIEETRPLKAARVEPEPAVARRSAEPRPRPAAGEKSAIDAATACLARGDNACVIRALSGRAQTAQELGLLIETYRAMGEAGQAYRNMAIYVQRYPAARRAEAYRQMLARRSE